MEGCRVHLVHTLSNVHRVRLTVDCMFHFLETFKERSILTVAGLNLP
jgi:hypothetical protein